MTQLAGLTINHTGNIINPDTRLCAMVYGHPKTGKTHMASGLDKFCQEEYNKRALIIPFESAHGGGVSTVRKYNIPWVQPANIKETEGLLRALQTDTTYGAVIIDNLTDLVKNVVQPYAMQFPSRENVATRVAGVPERSDYQTIGESTRRILNLCIALTKGDPKTRKHLVVNCLREEHRDNNNTLDWIGPDLPGALSKSGPAMFELLATIEIGFKTEPSPDNPKQMVRKKLYNFVTAADGVKLLGDRYNVFPAVSNADWYELMTTYWKPEVINSNAA